MNKLAHNGRAPHPVDVYVGGRVRAARLARDMSQVDLGDALGITFQQIQKYEKGRNRISCGSLLRICEVLGYGPAWFFEGAPGVNGNGSHAADPLHGLALTSGGQKLAAAYVAIESPMTRATVVALVEIMAAMQHEVSRLPLPRESLA